MPVLTHVPATTPVDEIARIVLRDGAVIVDDVVDSSVLDQVSAEMQPYVDNSPHGNSTISGRKTKRTGGLCGRSAGARDLIMHPLVRGVMANVITHSTGFQLINTEIISIDPSEGHQPLHRDQDIWPFPFPPGYETMCSMMWPLNQDYTVKNGATRVIPGSHKTGFRSSFDDAEIVQAEMTRGSVLFWTGSVYHSGAANKSDLPRQGVMCSYGAGWLRQEENQYLAVAPEVAKELDDDVLRMMGYERPNQSIGNGIDRSHPLGVFRPELAMPNYNDLSVPNYFPYAGDMEPVVSAVPEAVPTSV
jgi:ectoine hydroxylase-related dioxygenase (phytanoyl-CoA dioxygenase family)